MVKLNLGSANWSTIKDCSAKELLDFMSEGIVRIGGSNVSAVCGCRCGRRAAYVVLDIKSSKFLWCECHLSWLCEDCYEKRAVVDE